jgi:hypothetical protein
MPPTEEQLTPDVADVSLLLRTRTVGTSPAQGGLGSDTGPEPLTVFDETTRPTADEVTAVIGTAYGRVRPRIKGAITDDLAAGVRHAVGTYAVLLILASFFRESTSEAELRFWRELSTEAVVDLNDAADSGGARSVYHIGTLRVGSTRVPPAPNFDPIPGIDF